MTFPPSDSPDWTAIPGALRYLGSIDMTGTYASKTGVLAVSPASYDGAIVVIPLGSPASSSFQAELDLTNTTLGFATDLMQFYDTGQYLAEPFVAFIAAVIPGTWQVQSNVLNAAGSTWVLYVFAAPSFPLSRIVRDNKPLLVSSQGQHMSVSTGPHQPYDAQGQAGPAANTAATVTFPATANKRWTLDFALGEIFAVAAAAGSCSFTISDGAATIFSHPLEIPAAANQADRQAIGPGLGLTGSYNTAMTVTVPAAGAGVSGRVTAGAYLVN